jgi:hypothetical protein
MEDIIYSPNRKKLILQSIGCYILLFGGGGLFIGASNAPLIGKIIVALCLVCFIQPLIYRASRLIKNSPTLIISDDGLFISTPFFTKLYWSDITDMEIRSVHYQKFLCIEAQNIEDVIQRQKKTKQKLMKVNIAMLGTPFFVAENLLPVKLEEVIEQINKRRKTF